MRLAFLIVLLLALLGGLAGFLYLGSHPPKPHIQAIDHRLSNDQIVPK